MAEYNNSDPYLYPTYTSYIRNKWAPDTPPSALTCDGIGTCTHRFPKRSGKRLAAYVIFERLAQVDHFHQFIEDTLSKSVRWTLGRAEEFEKKFTSASEIDKARMERERKRQMAFRAANTALLIASAPAGIAPVTGLAGFLAGQTGIALASAKAGVAGGAAGMNLIASSYIGISGLFSMARDNPHLEQDLISAFESSWNQVAHELHQSIDDDLRDLMIGEKTKAGMDIAAILKSEDWFQPDPNLPSQIRKLSDAYSVAGAVNDLWKFERAYIVHTNSDRCASDMRGPSQYRICLQEYPGSAFWLYAINPSEENDGGHDDQGLVRGPKGYLNFRPNSRYPGRNKQWNDITLEDIVRSSMWVHQHNLQQSNTEKFNYGSLSSLFHNGIEARKEFGRVPGAFQIPICRNSYGEAISSVWEKDARNYPCMCGEWPWSRPGTWKWGQDQTPKFLDLTGFKFSEDWEDYCFDHNDCVGAMHITYGVDYRFSRKEGDDPIAEQLEHPFRKCKDPKEHINWGHPEKDEP